MKFQMAENVVIKENRNFIQKAEALKPVLKTTIQRPTQIVKIVQADDTMHGWKCTKVESADNLSSKVYGKGETVIIDFGQHQVGYLSMCIRPVGSPPDAPLHMRLTFGEMPVEVAEPFSGYDGWISSSWLQEKTLHIDVLPGVVKLSRRYCFRYLKIEVLDTSLKYRVAFDDLYCETVTSADVQKVSLLNHKDLELEKIDRVSIKTLEDCMQDVFEDGPKRDRRLWLGDLHLQALANYETFQDNDLVKRCLYLFAAVPNKEGLLSANLFIEPTLIPDDTYLFDYSLLFASTLHDYYLETEDLETLKDLWPTAYRQVELALARLDDRNILIDDPSWWSFIDWNDDLNKQTPSQGVLIYTLKKVRNLAGILGAEEQSFLTEKIEEVTKATLTHLWDGKKEFFISGEEGQVSWASQIWMVLADILNLEQNRKLLNQLLENKPSIGMNTPYIYHYLVEALLIVGQKDKAVSIIKQYWGGMINDGADTFWELYNPDDKEYSPYGSHLINSYCHAWSCTPTYLIRKYNL